MTGYPTFSAKIYFKFWKIGSIYLIFHGLYEIIKHICRELSGVIPTDKIITRGLIWQNF